MGFPILVAVAPEVASPDPLGDTRDGNGFLAPPWAKINVEVKCTDELPWFSGRAPDCQHRDGGPYALTLGATTGGKQKTCSCEVHIVVIFCLGI